MNLFGDGEATVIGLPTDFDFLMVLRGAEEIHIAMAFARNSGWNMIKAAVCHAAAQGAQVRLIAGADFGLTDPTLLKEWLDLARNKNFEPSIEAYLIDDASAMFHAKVILVRAEGGKSFAIIGSGNLTKGGLKENYECSIWTKSKSRLKQVEQWFEKIIDRKTCLELTPKVISDYRPRYRPPSFGGAGGTKNGDESPALIEPRERAAFVKEARQFFKITASSQKKKWRGWKSERWDEAIQNIRTSLRMYDDYDITAVRWQKFISIGHMGAIRQTYKKELLSQLQVISKTVRFLCDNSVPVGVRIYKTMNAGSDLNVYGVGQNIITKILCAASPRQWPVYNGSTEKTLLAFCFRVPHVMRTGDDYAAYASLMQELLDETGAGDMPNMDRFLHWYDCEHPQKKRKL